MPGDASAIPLLMKFIKLPGFGLNKVEGVLDVEVGLLTVVLGLADGIDKGVWREELLLLLFLPGPLEPK